VLVIDFISFCLLFTRVITDYTSWRNTGT